MWTRKAKKGKGGEANGGGDGDSNAKSKPDTATATPGSAETQHGTRNSEPNGTKQANRNGGDTAAAEPAIGLVIHDDD